MDVSVFHLAADNKNKRWHYYITLLQPLKHCCLLISAISVKLLVFLYVSVCKRNGNFVERANEVSIITASHVPWRLLSSWLWTLPSSKQHEHTSSLRWTAFGCGSHGGSSGTDGQSDLVSGSINQQLIRQSHSFDYICCSRGTLFSKTFTC